LPDPDGNYRQLQLKSPGTRAILGILMHATCLDQTDNLSFQDDQKARALPLLIG
jgi:hypothetical protein